MARALDPDGALIVGSTETLTGVCPLFESKRYLRAIYYVNAGNKDARSI